MRALRVPVPPAHQVPDPGVARVLNGDDVLVVWIAPDLRVSFLRGRVTRAALALAFSEGDEGGAHGHDSLVDASRVTAFDGTAAAALLERLGTATAVRRRALVRPEGVVGALVAGAALVRANPTVPCQVFTSTEGALAWLERAALARSLVRFEATVAEPEVVVRVRAALLRHGLSRKVGEVGRDLGMAERTLQRALSAARTSFREVQAGARLEAALAALADGEVKVAAVASCLGFRSVPHFTAFFRRHQGVTPGRWRVTRIDSS